MHGPYMKQPHEQNLYCIPLSSPQQMICSSTNQ